MKKMLTAIALTIALPAVAHAQTTPAPAPAPGAKMACCEKMKAEGKECCCKDMAKMDHAKHDMKAGADAHAGHDMSQKAPPAATPQNK